MLTRLGRELSQTEGAHYEGGPAVLVPCYSATTAYSAAWQAGRPHARCVLKLGVEPSLRGSRCARAQAKCGRRCPEAQSTVPSCRRRCCTPWQRPTEFAAWPPNMVATSWPPTQRPPARSQNFSRNFFSYFTRCLYHMYQAHSGRLFANEFTNLENGLHPLPPFPQRPTPTTRKRGVRPQGVLVRGRRQRHWISHGQHRVASLSTPWGPGNA